MQSTLTCLCTFTPTLGAATTLTHTRTQAVHRAMCVRPSPKRFLTHTVLEREPYAYVYQSVSVCVCVCAKKVPIDSVHALPHMSQSPSVGRPSPSATPSNRTPPPNSSAGQRGLVGWSESKVHSKKCSGWRFFLCVYFCSCTANLLATNLTVIIVGFTRNLV